jgi:hypothetical protein
MGMVFIKLGFTDGHPSVTSGGYQFELIGSLLVKSLHGAHIASMELVTGVLPARYFRHVHPALEHLVLFVQLSYMLVSRVPVLLCLCKSRSDNEGKYYC